MTSTLPNLPAVPALPAGTSALNAAALADLPTGSAPLAGFSLEFASLIAPAPVPAAAPAPASPVPAPLARGTCHLISDMSAAPAGVMPALGGADWNNLSALLSSGAKGAIASSAPRATSALDALLPSEDAAELSVTAPTRDQLEAALAAVLPVVQPLVESLLGKLSGGAGEEASAVSSAFAGSPLAATPDARSAQAPTLPGESAIADQSAVFPALHLANATLAADGAIELSLALPGLTLAAGARLETGAEAAPVLSGEIQLNDETPVRFEVVADLGLPLADRGEAVEVAGRASEDTAAPAVENQLAEFQTVTASASRDRSTSDEGRNDERALRANFAAAKAPSKHGLRAGAESSEINFLSTGDKQVKLRSPDAGIAVAQNDGMLAAPTEETRPTRNPESVSALPTRSDFQVAPMPAERITIPATSPAGQNFAERAVETVTNLVEAQFSASMQKSASVQLRLKFGGEDLSVRVAMRDGAVHTDFRTDSLELRAALSREWQALVAEAPDQLHRFLEPVFSAAPTSSTSSDSHSQFSRQQSPANPNSQQDLPQRAPRDPSSDSASPFARRSLVSESFVPEPVAPRVPALLPTSLRLSALA